MKPLLLFSAGISLGILLGASIAALANHQRFTPATVPALFALFLYGTIVGIAQLMQRNPRD
ncbi:hypothetical protein [Mycobacteroides abscessus]|uniref:hypothetical protein n=1 Tax=Mycobacteroides abscessus TaxID=36809 RepID=UPI000C265FFF|nr:hypothetical protein [Mycobacteroides abscessus]